MKSITMVGRYVLTVLATRICIVDTSIQIAVENLHHYINAFPLCHLFLINYHNVDISKHTSVPLNILRYIVLDRDPPLYPIAFSHANETTLREIPDKALNKYYHMMESSILLITNRKHCKAVIHLQPPEGASWYWTVNNYGMLKEPILYNKLWRYEQYKWKQHFISTQPQYFVLVHRCEASALLSEYVFIGWALSMWDKLPYYPYANKYYLIWRMKHSQPSKYKTHVLQSHYEMNHLQIVSTYSVCLHCNPCSRATLIETNDLSDMLLNEYTEELRKYGRNPRFMKITTQSGVYPEDFNGRKSRAVLFTQLRNLYLYDLGLVRGLIDIHYFSELIPNNSTLIISNDFPFYYINWEDANIGSCYFSNTVFHIGRHTSKHITSFQLSPLGLNRARLRFVSCHFEEILWLNGLIKLFDTFDLYVWITILLTIFIASKAVCHCAEARSVQFEFRSKSASISRPSFPFIIFRLFALLLDQDWEGFQKPQIRRTLLFLPVAFYIISEEYRSFSISEMTVPPPLIPFDTFDSLIKGKFNISALPFRLFQADASVFENINNNSHQDVNHEAFPVVSEFWLMLMNSIGQFGLLSTITLDQVTKVYLNNSKLFPGGREAAMKYWWNPKSTLESLGIPFIEKCDKTALILKEEPALQMQSKFAELGYPVYFGKDVIYESVAGYDFYGLIPISLLPRVEHFFQAGIVQWWKTYFDIVIKKTRITESKLQSFKGTNRSTAGDIKLVIFIYCFGHLIGFISVIIEVFNVCKFSVVYKERNWRDFCTYGIMLFYVRYGNRDLCFGIFPFIHLTNIIKLPKITLWKTK